MNISISIDQWKAWFPFGFTVTGIAWDTNTFDPEVVMKRTTFSKRKALRLAKMYGITLSFVYGNEDDE